MRVARLRAGIGQQRPEHDLHLVLVWCDDQRSWKRLSAAISSRDYFFPGISGTSEG